MKKLLRRTVSLSVAAIIFAQTSALGASKYFNDVTSKYSWAEAAIDSLHDSGIISGFNDGYFRPADTIKRCDFLVMLYNKFAAGNETEGSLAEDIDEGIYYEGAYKWASGTGILNASEFFRPSEPITRQDAFYLIFSCLDNAGLINSANRSKDISAFNDTQDLDSDKVEAVGTLAGLGLVNGYNGLIAPKNTMSRAEMAVVFYNVEKLYADTNATKGIKTDAQVGFGVATADSRFTVSTNAGTYYLVDSVQGSLSDENIVVDEKGKSGIVLQNDANLSLSNFSIKKTGDSVSSVNTGSSGVNSAIVLRNGSILDATDLRINTNANYANGITAYDGNNKITIKNGEIKTNTPNSNPIQISDNSDLNLDNVTIASNGSKLNAVSMPGKGGKAVISDSNISAYGSESRAIMTAKDTDVINTSVASKESVGLEIRGYSNLTVDNVSFSTGDSPIRITTEPKDAADKDVKNTTTIKNTDFPYVSGKPLIDMVNINSDVYITGCSLKSDMLFRSCLDTAVHSFAKGADSTVTLDHQDAEGDVDATISASLTLVLKNGSVLKSTLNGNQNGTLNVDLQTDDDKLILTGNCYLGYLQNHGNNMFTNIQDNSFDIYYNKNDANSYWLDGKTWSLPNGGELIPLDK